MTHGIKIMLVMLLGLALMSVSISASAHEKEGAGAHKTMASTNIDPKEVATIEDAVNAVYAVISGPAGPRDWVKMRALFVPGGRLAVRNPGADDGIAHMTLEDYENLVGPQFLKTGFFERSIHNEVVRFGDIAHVFSTYESRHAADDEKPFARGVNSMQLLHHDGRWWLVSIYWQAESEDAPIPAAFLP